MNKKGENLVGRTFERLTVIKRNEKNTTNTSMWDCLCDCGNIIITRGSSLRSGHTKSCGCLHNIHKNKSTFEGKNRREYNLWHNIKKRSYEVKNKVY